VRMTAGRKHAPVVAGCEPEWLARPLTDLIHHLTQNYKKPIALRLEAITATANHTRLAADVLGGTDHGSGAFAVRLSSLVTTLRLVLEGHAWSESDVLFPAAIAIETYGRSSAPFKRDALDILMEGIVQEHDLLRELLNSLLRTMEECVTAGLSPDLEIFVGDLEIVCFMIAEELDLEDRCLWPRMKELFDR
jgi:iron-sulfur cluster repair protein YtfE (RIC family)